MAARKKTPARPSRARVLPALVSTNAFVVMASECGAYGQLRFVSAHDTEATATTCAMEFCDLQDPHVFVFKLVGKMFTNPTFKSLDEMNEGELEGFI